MHIYYITINFSPVIRAGYRYQGPKGLLFRAAPQYFITENNGGEIYNKLWFGLLIGYSF